MAQKRRTFTLVLLNRSVVFIYCTMHLVCALCALYISSDDNNKSGGVVFDIERSAALILIEIMYG